MLYYVTRELHSYTIDRLLGSFADSWLPRPDFVQPLSYETLFALDRAPIGNYVFTDIDRLSGYEIDVAAEIAKRVALASPAVLISNPPHRVLSRYALLRRLRERGVNSFDVWRLDEERAPTAYPVFIRREHDALGPESALLCDAHEYRAALAELQASGRGLTGRIAVQYLPSTDGEGKHRKYGAFCFRGRIVPQHLMIGDSWIVKRAGANVSAEMAEAEEIYVRDNPHAGEIRRIFQLAEIDFGRIDYCVVDGRIEVFEINTNPSFPRARITQDPRMSRRKIVVEGVVAGFRDLDAAPHAGGFVRFRLPKPRLQRLRNRSWSRRLADLVALWRWRAGAARGPTQRAVESGKAQAESESPSDRGRRS